jgi:hypothetical protein
MHQLLSNLSHLAFWQTSIIFKNLKQLSLSKLGDHTEFMRRLKRVKQQYDVLMVQTLEDFNLLSQVVQFLLSLASMR